MQQYTKTAIFIGRFQPLHNAHVELLRSVRNDTDRILLLVGSDSSIRTVKNPFLSAERVSMLAPVLRELGFEYEIRAIQDHPYSNDDWAREVQSALKSSSLFDDRKPWLYGFTKDASSFYLRMFPQWGYTEIEHTSPLRDLSATDLRKLYFDSNPVEAGINPAISKQVPISTSQFLHTFAVTEQFKAIQAESAFLHKYKKQWEAAPYPPTFVTVDAVVLCAGHVLTVVRGSHPGKGLLALPGGFISQNETIREGIVRELTEETSIGVSEGILINSIRTVQVFDAPERSLRGRTITHAGLIVLSPTKDSLPKIKGGDDAASAKWIQLSDFYQMQNRFFEDHYHIICTMLGKVN